MYAFPELDDLYTKIRKSEALKTITIVRDIGTIPRSSDGLVDDDEGYARAQDTQYLWDGLLDQEVTNPEWNMPSLRFAKFGVN